MLVLRDHYTYRDLLQAYLDCRRRKRNKLEPQKFELNFGENLEVLLDEINSGKYRIGSSTVFTVMLPKPREIWAAQFRDRVIHHLLYNEMGAYFEKRFIEDTFSCIKGRGTLAASQRVEKFCRKATENWRKQAWVLQIDIANFFVSINRATLWGLMSSQFMNPDSLTGRLLKDVIFHDPTENPIIKSNCDFASVPRHKSLWYAKPGYGLPIGNLTSQFMSNVYLDELDHLVKHKLKARYYARYVDDAIFISHDRDQLAEWAVFCNNWLQENRELHLHEHKIHIYPADQGINFVGRVIKPFRVYPRRMTVGAAKEAVRHCLDTDGSTKAFDSVQSYLGIFHHANTYNLRAKICGCVCAEVTHLKPAEHMQKLLRTGVYYE